MCRFNDKPNDFLEMIDINGEEALEKSNIPYKIYVEEFKNIFDITEILNNKIRKEISEINIHRRNVIKKINNFQ